MGDHRLRPFDFDVTICALRGGSMSYIWIIRLRVAEC